MGKVDDLIKEIKKILKRDAKGLTIQELSEITKTSRITTSMALMNLIGQNLIEVREVGNCKLHYLKKGVRV